ncbi:MAG: cbb3-type cytochrome oxidase assembly protein CcoS [Yoonia sp.]|uniref:cbb3-type cytochrome oxidase assembly protein CcoS n=1 Tax=Rhodobacterales TaxID=204455 RepID=UPI001FF15947|nr:cbb3-type cytochrome oxidase assembly protein CcoS [Loktanella sp. F6476L]MCK0120020.1 cbb3-type cytochrome oxidase assembly protein CcoS [Loktanella sp. F6476L]
MNVLIVLVPVSLVLAIAGLLTFLWTLRSEQYDDLDGDAWRILVEDALNPQERAAIKGHSDAG